MMSEANEPALNNAPDYEDLEKRYPAVRRAYDFVLPSYQMLAARFEAADSRLAAVMNLASTLTLGAPILAKSIRPDISFHSPWFMVAMGLFVSGVGVGIAGRLHGTLRLPDPLVIYDRWLHKSEWTFMKDQIFFSAEHFDQNVKTVRLKGWTTLFIAALLGLEIVSLVIWIAR